MDENSEHLIVMQEETSKRNPSSLDTINNIKGETNLVRLTISIHYRLVNLLNVEIPCV